MRSLVGRWLPRVLALLVATATHAEIRDLGRYGPTCPVPDAPPSRSGVRVRVEPGLARIPPPVEPPMPIAGMRRAYILPGRWPAGAPPLAVFVGHDAAGPAISEGDTTVEALRQACPACRIGIAGSAGARRLGIHAVPAVIRVVDGVAHVTEGPP